MKKPFGIYVLRSTLVSIPLYFLLAFFIKYFLSRRSYLGENPLIEIPIFASIVFIIFFVAVILKYISDKSKSTKILIYILIIILPLIGMFLIPQDKSTGIQIPNTTR